MGEKPAALRRHPRFEPRSQVLFTHAPASERARRVLSKLRQAPRLIQAARDNIKDPPGIFVKVGIETWRGALKFIDEDLPRALSSVDDLHLLGDLADAQAEASQAVGAYIEYLESSLRHGRARRSGWARRSSSRRSVSTKASPYPSTGCSPSHRELKTTQEAFKMLAGRANGGDPLEAWSRTKRIIRPLASS